MSETARPRLRLGLVALNAALVLLLVGIEWWARRPLPPLPASSPMPVRPIRLAPLKDAPMPLALRGAYARAPLFNPDRKPAHRCDTCRGAFARGHADLDRRRLCTGMVAGTDSNRHAIRMLSKGDLVPGSNWVVQCIQPHHVCLDDGGQRLRLALKAAAPAGEDETPSAPIAATRPPIPSHPLAIRVPMAKPHVPSAPQSTAVRHAHVARASTRPTPPSAHLF